jgi:murein DD-endopeptidase MepM/ murein hydrolase activator NlpD
MGKLGKTRGGRKAGQVLWLLPVAVAGLLGWWILKNLDWEDPWINLPEETMALGAKTNLTIKAGDARSGLKKMVVTVSQDGQEKVVFNRTFPPSGEPGVEVEVPVTLEAKALGLKEGKGILRVAVRDRSWWNWFAGRSQTLSRDVVIDLVPLQLTWQGVNHLLHYGGTGVILYHLNKEVKESGVVAGDRLYQGFPNPKGAKGDHLVLFPIPLEPTQPFQVELVARPQVGQEARRRIPLNLKSRRWRQDNMNLSENFMRQVAATFAVGGGDLVQGFLTVNRDMRKADHNKVREICRAGSQPQPLWAGPFQRYLGKPMARFGDKRTYIHGGKTIDHQVHLGEDLASLERSPVPATNTGEVVWAAPLGIYGQTVMLDHGLGVFSMYSHLSQLEVKKGDRVEKGKSLGRTGATGLAGGDHLHYSVLLQGEFVDPREWWDPHWHKDQLQGLLAKASAPPGAAATTPEAAGKPEGKAKKTRRGAKSQKRGR